MVLPLFKNYFLYLPSYNKYIAVFFIAALISCRAKGMYWSNVVMSVYLLSFISCTSVFSSQGGVPTCCSSGFVVSHSALLIRA